MSDLSRNEFEFLRTDLDTALIFLNVADATGNMATRERNQKNARKAYDTVWRLMQKMSLDDSQRKELGEKLAVLKSRLQDIGQQF